VMYIVIEIACHECGSGKHVIHGIFDNKEEALKLKDKQEKLMNYFSNQVEVLTYDKTI